MDDRTIQQTLEMAVGHHQAGRLQEAERLYRQVLAQQPDQVHAIHNLGVMALQAQRNDVAIDLFRRAAALNPDFPEAFSNLGIALLNLGKTEEAIAALRRAVELKPTFAEAQSNLGNALRDNRQWEEAIAAYRVAMTIYPNLAEIHNNLGTVLKDLGRNDEAIAEIRRAIELNPNLAGAFNNLGSALREKGKLDTAISAFSRAIELMPGFAEAHNNLAIAMKDQGRLDDAAGELRRVIALKSDYPEAHNNLGGVLKDQGLLDEAIAEYRFAVALRPAYAEADSNLVYTLHFLPDCGAKRIADEHRRWNRQHAAPLKRLIQSHSNDRDPNRRLRIGYVSPDFRQHPVGRFLLPLFANHNREQFEIFAYSSVRSGDEMTERLRRGTGAWRDIRTFSDQQAADLIRKDRIDILIDLTMHMADNRMLLFARKPAPVQVTYLAYCSTTGLEAIDYRISDPYLDPPGTDESIYSERTVRLPRSYWCYEPPMQDLDLTPPPVSEKGRITFGCLNNFCKINSHVLRSWGTLMQAVANSRLVVHADQGRHRQRLLDELSRARVEGDRLQFVERLPMQDYLRQYQQIDIALDPFPYVGGTTSCDALWMGVPVVTLRGQTAVSRGGASILSNIGLNDLIADSPEQYIRIAADLANDLPRLSILRAELRERMLRSPLMDAPLFAKDMQKIYRNIWRQWCETGNSTS